MLTLDLTGLTDAQLDDVLAEYCSSFGHATILDVLKPAGHTQTGAAAVKMSTEAEAEALARNVRGSRCGLKVIIRLAQRGRHIPAITRRNFFHGSMVESVPAGAAS